MVQVRSGGQVNGDAAATPGASVPLVSRRLTQGRKRRGDSFRRLSPALLALLGVPPLVLVGTALAMETDPAAWVAVTATVWALVGLRLMVARLDPVARQGRHMAALQDGVDDPLALVAGDGVLSANAAYDDLCRLVSADAREDGPPVSPAAMTAITPLTVLRALCVDRATTGLRDLEQAAAEGRKAEAVLPLRASAVDGESPVHLWTVSVRPCGAVADREKEDGAVWRMTRQADGRRRDVPPGMPSAFYPASPHPWSESWDLAPFGVLEVSAGGEVLRVNAGLAAWLDLPRLELEHAIPLHALRAVSGPSGLPPDRLADVTETGVVLRTRGRDQLLRVVATHIPLPGGDDPTTRVFDTGLVSGTEAADGRSTGNTLIFLRDVTREHALREDLQRAEQRFQRFFQFAPTGLAFVDGEFRLNECNQTFLTLAGLDVRDAIGRPVAYLFQKEYRRPLLVSLGQVLAGGEMGAPLEARLAGTRDAIVHAYVRRFDAEDGGSGLILHLVDMTEQKNLETQFVQSQKMQAIGQLAGGVAHDFNNLLTAMIGFCDLLLLRHKPGDQSFSDIMQIKQNANRAANLVRQLLAFSRQQTLQPRVLDVTDVLAELSNLLRRLIGENIDLRMVHGRDLGLVRVDQGQLEQVIINLAVNARDAMPQGGSLSIITSNTSFETPLRLQTEEMPPGNYVRIDVVDTGVGIPAENLSRIFEPFFSTKEVGSGTGLGLSTVYGIVRQTGGFVFVESAPGEGARFSIYLPRLDQSAAAPVVTDDSQSRGAADLTGIGTILLVEDEDAVRVFGARALRNKGYRVLEARSGEEALALLHQPDGGQVDLIVSDVVMPQMDGPTLIEAVRQFRPDVKVIFISGYAEDRLRHSFKDGATIEFLPKPFSLKQLAAKVKEVMGGT